MVLKWLPNAPPKASKWARRPQDGSRGAKMVSMRLQEPPKDPQDGPKMFQDGPYGPQHDPKRPQRDARWVQDGTKRIQKGTNWVPKWDLVRFK